MTFDASHCWTRSPALQPRPERWDTAETHYQAALGLAERMPFVSEQGPVLVSPVLVDRDATGDRGGRAISFLPPGDLSRGRHALARDARRGVGGRSANVGTW